MKTLLLSSAIALTGSAALAGGYIAPVVEQPVIAVAAAPAQASNWSGGYVGGNLSWGKAKVTANDSLFNGLADEINDSGFFDEEVDAAGLRGLLGKTLSKPDGIGGALRGGYDWQSGNVVYGIGGEYNLGKIDGGLEGGWRDALAAASDELDVDLDPTVEISKAATLFARVGYAAGEWMPYALLGYTMADGKVSLLGETAKADLKGVTAGIGAERRFGENWSGYGEWTYTDFGDVKDADKLISVKMNQLKLGVNYRF